jgi:hypothetical protein
VASEVALLRGNREKKHEYLQNAKKVINDSYSWETEERRMARVQAKERWGTVREGRDEKFEGACVKLRSHSGH